MVVAILCLILVFAAFAVLSNTRDIANEHRVDLDDLDHDPDLLFNLPALNDRDEIDFEGKSPDGQSRLAQVLHLGAPQGGDGPAPDMGSDPIWVAPTAPLVLNDFKPAKEELVLDIEIPKYAPTPTVMIEGSTARGARVFVNGQLFVVILGVSLADGMRVVPNIKRI